MMHLITLITENIFAVIGFALYAGLVYYMVEKALRRYSGKGKKKDASRQKTRRNFAKNLPASNSFQDQNPVQPGGHM